MGDAAVPRIPAPVTWTVTVTGCPDADLDAVDALARLQLAVARRGGRVHLDAGGSNLRSLVELAGLRDLLDCAGPADAGDCGGQPT